ncbi:DUF4352 domain-containing protein [Streptomyces sp. bgisy154]|uniref:DUF4352 domain-containing protein n=1 Tax=Streptomyces sp. bgisy154 TaxID=3413794 RepID=UPI003D74D4EE
MRHTRTHTAAALAAAGLLALTACNTGEEGVNTTPASKGSAADSPTKGSAPSSPTAKEKAAVGDTLTLHGFDDGEQLDVTLKQWLPVAKSADQYFKPEDGKKWVAAQLELVNTGSKVYSDSPSNGAKVADGQGQRFDSWVGEITAGPAMASTVTLPKGEKALGWVVFEVPKDSKITTLQFGMASGLADETGQWTVG